MKFLNKKILTAGLLMTAFTFSCTDLDEELFSQVVASEFGKTEEEASAALGASLFLGAGNGNKAFTKIIEALAERMRLHQSRRQKAKVHTRHFREFQSCSRVLPDHSTFHWPATKSVCERFQ